MSVVSVLIIMTGFLLMSWDAEAANAPDPKQFFNGCSVKPQEPRGYFHRISGICLGHSFEPQYDKDCQVKRWDLGTSILWIVSSCILDGVPTQTISFEEKSRKLVEVKEVNGSFRNLNMPQEDRLVREVQTAGLYKGCTISHLVDNPYKRVITGSCAGHVFKNPELSGPGEEINVCRVQDLKNRIWIGDCIINGRWRPGSTEIAYDPTTIESTQAANEALVKLRAEASAKYPELVSSARARSKVDPVFLGIVLGEQWDRQNVNECLGRGARTNIIPFCSYGDKDGSVSHAGVSWTDCVVINKEKFDTSWIGSLRVLDVAQVQQYEGLAGLIVGMTALNMTVSQAEAEAKRESCKVYVSVLPDGTVGKVSTFTNARPAEAEKIFSLLIKKYGNQFSTNGWRRQWTLPGLTVSYLERAERADGGNSVLGSLVLAIAGVAKETQSTPKPAF